MSVAVFPQNFHTSYSLLLGQIILHWISNISELVKVFEIVVISYIFKTFRATQVLIVESSLRKETFGVAQLWLSSLLTAQNRVVTWYITLLSTAHKTFLYNPADFSLIVTTVSHCFSFLLLLFFLFFLPTSHLDRGLC